MSRNKGKFIISLDFELFWGLAGWTEEQLFDYKTRIEGAVCALKRITEVLSKYQMKCTIGYVSGIQYNNVDEFLEAAPTERPTYNNKVFSSYELLLSLVREEKIPQELLFRPDAVEMLKNNPLIELASHTFSHYYALEEGQTITQFESDIKTAKEENKKNGIDTVSIIFPRNQIPREYKKICADCGFTHIRGNEESLLYRSESTPSKFDYKRVLRLIDCYFNLTGHHSFKTPKRDVLTDVTASRFLRPYSKALSFLEPLKIKRIKKDMLYAARHGEIYHLWWHPHNFGLFKEECINQLIEICQWFDSMRTTYEMESLFMREVK